MLLCLHSWKPHGHIESFCSDGVWFALMDKRNQNQHEMKIKRNKIRSPVRDARWWCVYAPVTQVIRGILAQPSATWKDIRSCVMAVSQVGLWPSWRWDKKTEQELPISWKTDQMPHLRHFHVVEWKRYYTKRIGMISQWQQTTNIYKCWNQQLDWQNILDHISSCHSVAANARSIYPSRKGNHEL